MEKIKELNEKLKNDIHSYMPKEETMRQIAEYFSIFSDSTRIRILSLLAMRELCVGDISDFLKCNQTTVSHQLKILRANNIVKYRRNGKIIFYSLFNKEINELMNNVVNLVFA